MIRLIRIIAFIVGIIAMASVYSKPEVREAIMMSINMESEYDEYEYDESDYDDNDYAYDDYDY